MRKNSLFYVFLFLIISTFQIDAQKKTAAVAKNDIFKINIKTNGLKTHCLLAYHQGANKYKIDSIPFNQKGEATFIDTGKKVRGGIYLLVFPTLGNNYFEFLVSNTEKNMEMIIDTAAIHKVQIKNSEENTYFYNEINFVAPLYKEISELNAKRNDEKIEKSEKEKIDNRLREIEKSIQDQREKVIKEKPNLLYSKIMKMMKEIEVPEPPKDAKGNIIDSTFQYNYYKEHYWDNTDLNDDRLLYTPIFDGKYKTYFEKVIYKHPDSIKVEIDNVLGKIKDPNSMMMRFMLGNLINEYANSKIMGQDALYVHLVKNYYTKGKAPWADSATVKKMQYDAEDLEPILIGKTAPDFSVFDTTLKTIHKLYDLKSKYKILVFWNQDCGHCKKEVPKLDSIYPDLLKKGADVFAVCTVVDKDAQIDQWKQFIKDKKLRFKNYGDPRHQLYPFFQVLYKIKATPEYYILDNENKIIAKKLAPDQMLDFIDNYERLKK